MANKKLKKQKPPDILEAFVVLANRIRINSN